jgi:DNA-binding NarL/FixJ family response regulator
VIRVMLVDDQEMIRIGLATIIDAMDGMCVVASAPDGITALATLATTPADVILMDLRMPGIDGVETTRRIRLTIPAERTRIVVLTTFDQDANVLAALRAGANGFLSKAVSPTELAAAITEVAAGGGALSATAAAALIANLNQAAETPVDPVIAARFGYLTGREHEIVEAAAAGLDNAAIAQRLFISQHTVKTHLNRAMAKVDAHDRAQLVTLAYRAGIRPS